MSKLEVKNGSKKNKGKLSKDKISRRKFFEVSAVAGAAGAAAGVSAPSGIAQESSVDIDNVLPAKERETFPVLVTDKCKQMDHKYTVFSRMAWDKSLQLESLGRKEGDEEPPAGWTQLDEALDGAGWTINDTIADGSASGIPHSTAYRWEGRVHPRQYEFENPEDAAKKVKKAARFLGASLVGISKHDKLWDYSRLLTRDEEPSEEEVEQGGRQDDESETSQENVGPPREMFEMIEPDFPFEPKSVIVVAFEMDYVGMGTSPSCIESAATGLGYSKMAATGLSIASFIRQLGYKAFACGNDVSLSVPYAIAAGLGELGRNGLLVTREFGPRVRIAKIYTELEMKKDKPKTFGVWEFCQSCRRCAESCPPEAISTGSPTLEGTTISNNPGVLKWYVDPEKCRKFWGENRTDCANCITACPYNKPPMWHHRLIAASASLPGAPLHYTMAKMDKIFGFGDVNDIGANRDFWDRED